MILVAIEVTVAGAVVVCLDKFRGSLTAVQASAALGRGLRAARPELRVILLPSPTAGRARWTPS